MTDRELLELAAKAAGIDALHDPQGVLRDCTGFHRSMNIFAAKPWNPLTDDGDALRLAVKLGVLIGMETLNEPGGYVRIAAGWNDDTGWPEVSIEEKQHTDPYAATRRAIVRAAAEIGRNMK